jgi:hypothetical protein
MAEAAYSLTAPARTFLSDFFEAVALLSLVASISCGALAYVES